MNESPFPEFLLDPNLSYEEIKERIKYHNVKIKKTDNENKNCIHYSIQHPKEAFRITKLLLKNNADPNLADINFKTPLFHCCENYNGNIEVIQLLIKHGADPDIKDNFGYSSLFIHLFKNTFKLDLNNEFTAVLYLMNKSDLNNIDNIGNTGINKILFFYWKNIFIIFI